MGNTKNPTVRQKNDFFLAPLHGTNSYDKAATTKSLDIDFKTVDHFYSGILISNFDF